MVRKKIGHMVNRVIPFIIITIMLQHGLPNTEYTGYVLQRGSIHDMSFRNGVHRTCLMEHGVQEAGT